MVCTTCMYVRMYTVQRMKINLHLPHYPIEHVNNSYTCKCSLSSLNGRAQ